MKEKLIIQNFGPIDSIDIELKRFTILLGEQGTGKSTVGKLIAVCRYFTFIAEKPIVLPLKKDRFENGLRLWGLHEYLKNGTHIKYICQDYEFTANATLTESDKDGNNNENSFTVTTFLNPKTVEFESLLREYRNQNYSANSLHVHSTSDLRVSTTFLQNEVAGIMHNPSYIFTERGLQSIFSLGKSSISNLSDSLFNYFDKSTLIFSQSFSQDTAIEPLNISYKNVNGIGLVSKSDKHGDLKLSNAASGYQSLIPIVLLFKYYINVQSKKKTFIIEEPEMNLFPKTQYELVKFFAENLNLTQSILLTTHSPYILTSLNNLMYAYHIGQIHPEETKKIIAQKYWVNHEDVSAYMMLPNGLCSKIVDNEGMIKVESIDGVSADLNKDFNAIMNIELSIV